MKHQKWRDMCYDYLRESGEIKTTWWLFENIRSGKNGRPKSVRSASQLLRKDLRIAGIRRMFFVRETSTSKSHGWYVETGEEE